MDRLHSGDEYWRKYADFIDSLATALKQDSQTSNLFEELESELTNSGGELSQLSHKIQTTFARLQNNEIFTDLMDKYIDSMFPVDLIRSEYSKDSDEAGKYFNMAKQCMDSKQYSGAVCFYSKAICYSSSAVPESDSDKKMMETFQSVLFDQRSIAFFHNKQYYDCVLDIEQTLCYDYPGDRNKLYQRMAQAALKEDFENVSKLQKVFNYCQNIDYRLDAEAKNKILSNLQEKISQLQSTTSRDKVLDENDFIASPDVDDTDFSGLSIKEPNSQLLGASQKVQVQVSAEKGRYFVAAQPIKTDDVLFAESPFSIHFADTVIDDHCANCLRRLITPLSNNNLEDASSIADNDAEFPCYSSFVSCPSCNKFIFCDQDCRDSALNRYHKLECKHLLFAMESHIGVAYLALRTLLSSWSMDPSPTENDISSLLENPQLNCYHQYQSLLKLQTHSEHHDPRTNVCYILTAFFLLQTLKKKQFANCNVKFGDNSLGDLFRNLQQLNTNVVTIFEQDFVPQETSIGVGFYPTISLLNHSCDPDLLPIYVGSKLVLKSSRNIEENQEVSFCYGPTYRNMNYAKRQHYLRNQYYFDCRCTACLARKECYIDCFCCVKCNGPAFLVDSDDDSLNVSGQMKCSRCEHLNRENIETVVKQVEEAVGHQQAGIRFLKQGTERNDDDDIVAALVSLYRADVIFSDLLYILNPLLLKIKSEMIDCYLKMGHYDRGEIYSRQLIKIYSNHLPGNPDLSEPLYREQVRLVKILWLELEEAEDNHSKQECCAKIEQILELMGDKHNQNTDHANSSSTKSRNHFIEENNNLLLENMKNLQL